MRQFIVILVVVLVVLQSRLWLSDGGLRELRELQDDVEVQSARNAELAARNEALVGEVTNLKQGVEAAEERARSDLGMVGENETFFLVVVPEDAP